MFWLAGLQRPIFHIPYCRLKELPPEVEAQWRSGEYAETARARAQRAAQKPET